MADLDVLRARFQEPRPAKEPQNDVPIVKDSEWIFKKISSQWNGRAVVGIVTGQFTLDAGLSECLIACASINDDDGVDISIKPATLFSATVQGGKGVWVYSHNNSDKCRVIDYTIHIVARTKET